MSDNKRGLNAGLTADQIAVFERVYGAKSLPDNSRQGLPGLRTMGMGWSNAYLCPALAQKMVAVAEENDRLKSDALDLVRLSGDLVRSDESVQALRSAPFDLATLVAQVERWFMDDALRTARQDAAASRIAVRVARAELAPGLGIPNQQ